MKNFENIYNELYSGDYREHLSGYEIARWQALDHFITHILDLGEAGMVLDYGAGSGLHVGLWDKVFTKSSLYFCDITPVAMEKFGKKYKEHAKNYRLINDNKADFSDNSFDVVVSIEVMEHVEDLKGYLKDIQRILKPGGHFIWTTPCANAFSVEHIFSSLTGKIDKTDEGYRRWRWEDPTHVRRLKSKEIESVLNECGFDTVQFRFRSHLFSFLCSYFPLKNKFMAAREKAMTLDYTLLRRLPNGASMLGSAQKARYEGRGQVKPTLI